MNFCFTWKSLEPSQSAPNVAMVHHPRSGFQSSPRFAVRTNRRKKIQVCCAALCGWGCPGNVARIVEQTLRIKHTMRSKSFKDIAHHAQIFQGPQILETMKISWISKKEDVFLRAIHGDSILERKRQPEVHWRVQGSCDVSVSILLGSRAEVKRWPSRHVVQVKGSFASQGVTCVGISETQGELSNICNSEPSSLSAFSNHDSNKENCAKKTHFEDLIGWCHPEFLSNSDETYETQVHCYIAQTTVSAVAALAASKQATKRYPSHTSHVSHWGLYKIA